ncbi:MAG: PilT/PilU family type 4a pilus ATPase [Victivallaceae bacterium]|nr:PilT/PilU family type 4a pilus ATPase [Victivallaceae bacterium]MDD3703252.1 PilT/PilU family type 4a pilus ATPase [Victivallaceae bacterium]MDD4317491.1 PilT/PilU family type 4a pilus ATPase [Victivallaceae bacterium]MDD5663581.1 PilT/PilU family type 4a pilus ATPase [Victivallaceae bacterium]NLK84012.1 PilT/PilU family type 4a pilus ATPase [Lentisphaerota bacterium]
MNTIAGLLQKTFDDQASDLFIAAGKSPRYRRQGIIISIPGVEKSPQHEEEISIFRNQILRADLQDKYRIDGSCDAGYTLQSGKMRFRINFYRSQEQSALVARPIPLGSSLSFEDLNLPPLLKELAECPRGLILIAGSSGSGKSTTMSAMINHINNQFQKHIVTIEDPIEYIHNDLKSWISQREIGVDTAGFNEALTNVVRESPDVIVIGEMRDQGTMQTAITAALTGHLVISTVHTSDVVQSLERIINTFPEHLRSQAADDLALALQAVIAQRLLPSLSGESMIPAVEIMLASPLVRSLVAERNFSDLEQAIKHGGDGMVTFDRAILALLKEGKISHNAGVAAAAHREEFLLLTRDMESGIDTFRTSFGGEDTDSETLNMKRLLHSAAANSASDLLITTGTSPILRINGELVHLDLPPLTAKDTRRLFFSIITERQRLEFEEQRELDFALTTRIKTRSDHEERNYRFRVNGFYQRGCIGAAFRVIPNSIPSPEELSLPPQLLNLIKQKQGLILITGPTGHGKSTTQACLIDQINTKTACHIVTIEDPIEYVHVNKKAVIEQREINSDTLSFANALKFVLRQDPDVILVGEMRDPETIATALTAAETGHLVLATLHTNNAPQSIDRIVDSFPAHQQNQIKIQLAGSLLGVVAQRLLSSKDGTKRIAAFEIMLGTSAVQTLIREGKTSSLKGVIETSYKDGMVTMEHALTELYSRNLISQEEIHTIVKDYKTNRGY